MENKFENQDKEIGTKSRQSYALFWDEYLKSEKESDGLFANRKSGGNYLVKGVGLPGVGIGYNICNGRVYAQLEISKTVMSSDKKLLPHIEPLISDLRNKREDLESKLNSTTVWDDGAAKLKIRLDTGAYTDDQSKWNQLHRDMADKLKSMSTYFDPYIKELKSTMKANSNSAGNS